LLTGGPGLHRVVAAGGVFEITSGDCTVANSATCFRSPNYPSNYTNTQQCIITAREDVTLSVEAFNVEGPNCGWDSLTVNGNQYCGTTGPGGVQVAAGSTITFTSDSSVTSYGFEICGACPPGTTQSIRSGYPSLRHCSPFHATHPVDA
jgi:hypothetical protein